MDSKLAGKLAALCERIGALESVAVAFSAGVDSTFVLKASVDVLGAARVLAVTGKSPSVPEADLDEAVRLAASIGAEHVVIETDEFANPDYTANPTNRCYYCKSTLYTHMQGLLTRRGIKWILSGTNADDLGDWRPGLTAADEQRVIAPAADAGLTKEDIRQLSAAWGLSTFDKPASPCLSSRIPYGQEVTPEKLRAVEAGERFLRETFSLRECRVRHYGDFARLEVETEHLAALASPAHWPQVERHFRELGFARVEIDPRGFRSGALNEVIAFGRRQGNT